jgi:hypothetical protein
MADDSYGAPNVDMASVLKTAAAEWKLHAAGRLVFHGEIRMVVGPGADGDVLLELGDYVPALMSNGGPAAGAGTSTTHRAEKAAPAAESNKASTTDKAYFSAPSKAKSRPAFKNHI